jgi:hypothetical protein
VRRSHGLLAGATQLSGDRGRAQLIAAARSITQAAAAGLPAGSLITFACVAVAIAARAGCLAEANLIDDDAAATWSGPPRPLASRRAVALGAGRRLNYDVVLPPMRGQPQHVGRDSVLMGTALSAPVTMLAAQAVCTVRLARGDDALATRTLGGLGAAMTAGYLVERTGRQALTPRGAERVVTPIVVAGTSLALIMALLGLRPARSS